MVEARTFCCSSLMFVVFVWICRERIRNGGWLKTEEESDVDKEKRSGPLCESTNNTKWFCHFGGVPPGWCTLDNTKKHTFNHMPISLFMFSHPLFLFYQLQLFYSLAASTIATLFPPLVVVSVSISPWNHQPNKYFVACRLKTY